MKAPFAIGVLGALVAGIYTYVAMAGAHEAAGASSGVGEMVQAAALAFVVAFPSLRVLWVMEDRKVESGGWTRRVLAALAATGPAAVLAGAARGYEQVFYPGDGQVGLVFIYPVLAAGAAMLFVLVLAQESKGR